METTISSLKKAVLNTACKWLVIYDILITLLAIQFTEQFIQYPIYLTHILPNLRYALPACLVGAGYIAGNYDKTTFNSFWKLLLVTLSTGILAIIFLTLYENLIPYTQIGRYILLLLFLSLVTLSGIMRIIVYFLSRFHKIRILMIGEQPIAHQISQKIKTLNPQYQLVSCLEMEHLSNNQINIATFCKTYRINLIIMTNEYAKQFSLLERCFEPVQQGCQLMDETLFFEQAFEQVLVDKIDPSYFYISNLSVQNSLQAVIKRIIDLFFCLIGFTILLTLIPIIWLILLFTDRGPLFYHQTRLGRFGKPFTIHKLRTMTVNAEADGKAVWANAKDTRITMLGKFLRKTRLDELPQFWNVLKGEMSLVGPRPERPELVKQIEQTVPLFSFRHFVKPGITGFAQIRYRYGASIEDSLEKLQYDLYYVKSWSLLLDLQIILRTISSLMNGAR